MRRELGWVVIGSLAYFVAAITLLHGLRPDVDPVARVTSEYAIGRYGSLMTSASFAFAVALIALGIGLARALGGPDVVMQPGPISERRRVVGARRLPRRATHRIRGVRRGLRPSRPASVAVDAAGSIEGYKDGD